MQKLEKHLSLLKNKGHINLWHDRSVKAGTEWRQEIEQRFNSADIILLVVSCDFMASDYCYSVQMKQAIERHERGEARVIPILLRSVDFSEAPFSKLQVLPANATPIMRWGNQDDAFCEVAKGIRDVVMELNTDPLSVKQSQKKQSKETERKLRAMIAEHRGFLQDRLSSFVGRQSELAEIQQRIEEKMKTGGYLTITGQAGQGKSSLIAKLVARPDHDINEVVFHFIPLNPGPDHQVGLLRNLMARLILKYDLSDLYVASESRAVLRDYFSKVLQDVVAQGKQEVIFIDGLDQLEEDLNGHRDLSFLPDNVPAGIVFILGTRPDDTLHPLKLLKPFEEYHLPPLSRGDFDLILSHRQVSLERMLVDQFYAVMERNALYLDLLAKELPEIDYLAPHEIIAHLDHNPGNIFSIAIARFKRQLVAWREVLKPILGLLLTAREPLELRSLRSILQIEDDRLRDGIQRLEGLLIDAGRHHYTLFHLKLRDYLRQYVFATNDEEDCHARLASWCEQGGLARIWEDTKDPHEQSRRTYARKHVVAHWYSAHQWDHLFVILDEGSYGRAKEQYDTDTRSYIQDLDFGRRAAAWSVWNQEEALTLLPRLWQYTLLRCSLRSRADNYPDELFQLMLLLGKEREVIGYTELLTNPVRKSRMLQMIAARLTAQPGRQAESVQMFQRAYGIAQSIGNSNERMWALRELVITLAQVQLWELAEEIIQSITEGYQQASALSELAIALAQAKRWKQAKSLWKRARSIAEKSQAYLLASTLSELVTALATTQLWKQPEEVATFSENKIANSSSHIQMELKDLVGLIKREIPSWKQIEATKRFITLTSTQIKVQKELATALALAERWELAEPSWEQTDKIVYSITTNYQQKRDPGELGTASIETQRVYAEAICVKAEMVMRPVIESHLHAEALSELAVALGQAQRWQQAEEVVYSLSEKLYQVEALSGLALALTQAQQWQQAERLWKQTEEVARSIAESDPQARALGSLVTALIQAQRWQKAEEIARSMTKSDQAQTFRQLVSALKRAQQWKQAEEIAHSLPQKSEQEDELRDLAITLAQAQRWKQAKLLWDQAEEVARSVSKSAEMRAFKAQIWTAVLSNVGWWDQAEEVARSITESNERAIALRELAVVLTQAQRWQQAEPLWKQAEEAAHSIMAEYVQAEELGKLAIALTQSQRWEQAEKVASSIKEKDMQVETLSKLATALTQSEQQERADVLWKRITKMDLSIAHYKQVGTLSTLAVALTQAQRWEQADVLWKQATTVAHSITDTFSQHFAFQGLRIALTQVQRWEQAEEAARSVIDDYQQAGELGDLVADLAQAQQWEQAETIVHSIAYSDVQAGALRSLAVALEQTQRPQQAEPVWKQAEKAVYAISLPARRLSELSALVSALIQVHRWKQAEEVAHSITESHQQAKALRDLTVALVRVHQWEQAEEIVKSITESDEQMEALRELVKGLFTVGDSRKAIALVQRLWLYAETQQFALQLFSLAVGELITLKPDIGIMLYQVFQWVNTF